MRKQLKAGNLNVLYQDGFLRYIQWGDHEVIRMINHAVRDHNWGTVPMQISKEKVIIKDKSFQITYQGKFLTNDIDFDLECTIVGSKKSEISFSYRGMAKSRFRKNRIGFTVMHPIAPCAGHPVTITDTEGGETRTEFPRRISAHQPFKNISKMVWFVGQGGKAFLSFEGDVFETEDQRNWTDASFKTYCTPLDLPFPVQLKEGDLVEQKVVLKFETREALERVDKPIVFKTYNELIEFPNIGAVMELPGNGEKLIQGIKDIGLDYVRIDFPLDHPLDSALTKIALAQQLKLGVELCVFTDQHDFVDQLTVYKDQLKSVKTMVLFGDSYKTTPAFITDQVPQVRELFPKTEVFAGTDAFFTELNREPVDGRHVSGVSYSINPQVHAFDDLSLIETLEAQAYTVESAKQLFPGKKIRISPVSFHMRWNPNATDSGDGLRKPTGGKDPRQYSFFGACWFLISLKYLAESKVDAITYFETTGENGWIKNGIDPEEGIQRSPIYYFWQELNGFKKAKIRRIKSEQPLLVDAIVFEQEQRKICLVVNWSKKDLTVKLPAGFVPKRFTDKAHEKLGILMWGKWKGNPGTVFEVLPQSITLFEKS
ncbi:hypothetical protein [Pararhodonellum marinum]|uniref:hypothetical protein n=1 Tax=Pararhodonellum marinum TaxID=2755358 RepID=UPI00189063DA|nr:hypothetical protein [Pararhodonellum marinum]